MRASRRSAAFVFAALLTGALSAPVLAQEYPSRPMKIVVGFPPGGGTDTAARVIAQGMSQGLGQTIVIENKPGAAGTLGAAEVARSAPDGTTLLVTPGGHAIFGAIFKSLPFDTVSSFEWISSIATIPFFVVVPAKSEFLSLADLIAKAKANPVTFGSAGPGTTHHLGIELLANRTGTKFLHVPYRGDAPVVGALLAGEVQFGLATQTLIGGHIRAGTLRTLAVTSDTRSNIYPGIPTVEQAAGIANYDVRSWFALAAPAGTPKPIVERLNAELRKALAVPEVRARLDALGGEVAATTPQEMHDRVARELALWTTTVNEAGIPKQ
jgi:tripartite-type tricarboxylate transporter receptor subunit TctC